MLMDHALEYRRLRAPRESGQALIDPPLGSVGELLATNLALASARDYDVQGISLTALARQARGEMLRRAVRYTSQYRDLDAALGDLDGGTRVLLSGHQPQLFHPGVWFKNFVLSAQAAEHQAVGVNLLIDSDTIKSAALHVPSGSVKSPILETVPFDRPSEEIPYEERRIEDEGLFRSFGARVAAAIEPLVPNPLIKQFWPLVVEQMRGGRNLGACLAQARHRLEGAWGLTTLELPQSALGRLPAFHWFTAHLLAHLPRLWEVHNSSLAEYRSVHHLRSKAQPVPDLASQADWLEAPLWLWTTSDLRRRRVFARQRGEQILLSDRAGVEVALDLTPEGTAERAVEQLAALEGRGIKLRTRALLTTMFARLMLSDLFLHGIGGAKYDQLTDQLVRRFFQFQPPSFLTLSATFRLPIERQPLPPEAERRVEHTLRELVYHPERYLDLQRLAADERREAAARVAEKRRWVQTAKTPQNAHARHVAIEEANAGLQPWLAAEREALLQRRQQYVERRRAEAILASREYAFCLFPGEELRASLLELSTPRSE